jgi:hypothetical protein
MAARSDRAGMQMDATRTASTHVILPAGRAIRVPLRPNPLLTLAQLFFLYYFRLNSNQNAVLLNDSSLKAR